MWYGCLPSATVIGVVITLPYIVFYFENKYIIGNPYRRFLSNRFDFHTYLRDIRLGNGDPYKQVGFECVCDEEKEEKVCSCP